MGYDVVLYLINEKHPSNLMQCYTTVNYLVHIHFTFEYFFYHKALTHILFNIPAK